VVNGGLATLLLTEFVRTELGGTLSAFTAKHVAPLFCGRAILLGAEHQSGKWLLRAFDDEDRLAVEIEAND
jgi:3-methylfumaryl-CoA hydratase